MRVTAVQLLAYLFTVQAQYKTYLVRIHTHWNAQSPSKPKIGKFDDTLTIYKQILWFEVTVNNTTLVTEQHCL
jgi:hypothetical protein